MRDLLLGGFLLVTATGPLAAQAVPDTQAHAPELRERIERRFAERVKRELDLDDGQAAQLKSVAMKHGRHRKALRHRERDLRQALDALIDDGATSNQDSVARLTRELLDLRVEYAESWREEMKLLSFLTPVQRARLLVMRERLIQRAHEMRDDRRGFRHRGDGH
jgi:LTXXQ motif family protein